MTKGESEAAASIEKIIDSRKSVESQWVSAIITSDIKKIKDLERSHSNLFQNFELKLLKEIIEIIS
jgi:hypothetical protein